jgi:hypothetical protein
MDDYMDSRDVDIRDILLGIVAEVGHAFRTQLNIELKDSYFTKRLAEVRDTLFSDVEIQKNEVTLGNLKTTFGLNRQSNEFRSIVRDQAFKIAESLAEEVNVLLEDARVALKVKQGLDFDDFVLVIDGLDKIERLRDGREQHTDIAGFFLDNANQLKSIRAHTIWTAPLKVVRSYGMEIAQRYDGQPIVVPMIRTRFRNGQPCPIGISIATKIIERRLEGFDPDSIIEKTALESIVKYSGGHSRMLIQLVRYAGTFAEMEFPIRVSHATRAINSIAKTLIGSIHDDDWQGLVELERSTTKNWDISKEDNTRLLEQLCVLEYVNGEGDGIGQALQWYAVHPIVNELPRFEELWKETSSVVP